MAPKTALITGATGGLGREFARIHAERGGNLVLVGRRLEQLNEMKAELEREYHVVADVVVADLRELDAPERVYERVKELGVAVDYLINNAGFGGGGTFAERPMEADVAMVQVNVLALTKLTKLFLPDFLSRGSGRVLNVSSVAGTMPGPLQAVYFATKNYVTALSNALWEELRGMGVTVTNLMPGPLDTGFWKVAGFTNIPMAAHPPGPEGTARRGYEAMLRGKLDVYGPLPLFLGLAIRHVALLPKRLVLALVRRMQTEKGGAAKGE